MKGGEGEGESASLSRGQPGQYCSRDTFNWDTKPLARNYFISHVRLSAGDFDTTIVIFTRNSKV